MDEAVEIYHGKEDLSITKAPLLNSYIIRFNNTAHFLSEDKYEKISNLDLTSLRNVLEKEEPCLLEDLTKKKIPLENLCLAFSKGKELK